MLPVEKAPPLKKRRYCCENQGLQLFPWGNRHSQGGSSGVTMALHCWNKQQLLLATSMLTDELPQRFWHTMQVVSLHLLAERHSPRGVQRELACNDSGCGCAFMGVRLAWTSTCLVWLFLVSPCLISVKGCTCSRVFLCQTGARIPIWSLTSLILNLCGCTGFLQAHLVCNMILSGLHSLTSASPNRRQT